MYLKSLTVLAIRKLFENNLALRNKRHKNGLIKWLPGSQRYLATQLLHSTKGRQDLDRSTEIRGFVTFDTLLTQN